MKDVTRRAFLISGAAVGGGVLVGYLAWPEHKLALRAGPDESILNAWLIIRDTGEIVVVSPHVEMGQGVHTSLPMLVADELEADWHQVSVKPAPVDPVYVNVAMITEGLEESEMLPGFLEGIGLSVVGGLIRLAGVQITGGSSSIRDTHHKLRIAGAAAKAMLIETAARRWGVRARDCRAELGAVRHPKSGRLAGFGELAAGASLLTPPAKPSLKSPSEYNFIGTPMPRLDIPAKVDGSAGFGIDVRLPDMSYAAIRMPDSVDGRIKSFNADALEEMTGVQAVVSSDRAVAAVARTYWQAKKALEAIVIEFDEGAVDGIDGDGMKARFEQALDEGDEHIYLDQGEAKALVEDALDGAGGRIIEASYSVPYLAHACMEPINCTAHYDGIRCEIHIPTQAPTIVRDQVAEFLDIEKHLVSVTPTYLGGGFGRRVEAEVALQAVAISKEIRRPVQLIWSREDDTRNDVYRPGAAARLSAVLGDDGMPAAIMSRSTSQSVSGNFMERWFPAFASSEPDTTSTEGLSNMPYEIENRRVEHVLQDLPIPVGFWRSVGHSFNAFFLESFIDELAAAGPHDPFEFRRRMLGDHPRFLRVLDELEEMSGFHDPTEDGVGRGLAIHRCFGSIVGEVAEVRVVGSEVRVERVSCVIDCGDVVNPDTIEAQMEGGIIFGMTAAIYGRIDFAAGQPVQSNFHDYRMTVMSDCPDIQTRIIRSGARLGGVGEPSVPPIAPAICNAIYAATGRRVRDLPIL